MSISSLISGNFFENTDSLRLVAERFCDGCIVDIRPVGNGHINDTYLVETQELSHRYILQRINDNVFSSPEDLMDNMLLVTEHLNGPLRVIRANDGRPYARIESGPARGYWRMLTYIENSYAIESLADYTNRTSTFREIGRAYGAFISSLADLPPESLHIIIEGFHDTRKRFEQFRKACSEDKHGRAANAAAEIRFAFAHEKDVDILNDCVAKGEIPLRVVHNDTKTSNILLDRATGKAACVIDLDTVMPGLSVTDFGDAIRSGAATGREDEPINFANECPEHDPGSRPEESEIMAGNSSENHGGRTGIALDLELYRSYAEGFIEGCPDLTDREIELLPVGAKVITLECGLRFLTDYLEGDTYFKTDYPEHNLARCRTQFSLLRDMEKKWEQLMFIHIS